MARRPRRRLPPGVRRLELLAAAEVVLRDKGGGARLEEVLSEARASRGLFYRYFRNWEDLVAALRATFIDELSLRLRTTTGLHDADWWDRLDGLIPEFVGFAQRLGPLHGAVLFDAGGTTPLSTQRLSEAGGISEFLRKGVDAGICEPLDPESTARLVTAVAMVAAAASLIEPADAPTVAAARRIVRATVRPR